MSLTLPRHRVPAIVQHWIRVPRIPPRILLPLPLPSQQHSFPRRCFSSGASPLLNSSKSTANAVVNKKTTPLPTKGPMSALRYKTGKTSKRKGGPGLDAWSVVGYSTAEAIDLIGLQHDLCTSVEDRQQIFTQVSSVPFLFESLMFTLFGISVQAECNQLLETISL